MPWSVVALCMLAAAPALALAQTDPLDGERAVGFGRQRMEQKRQQQIDARRRHEAKLEEDRQQEEAAQREASQRVEAQVNEKQRAQQVQRLARQQRSLELQQQQLARQQQRLEVQHNRERQQQAVLQEQTLEDLRVAQRRQAVQQAKRRAAGQAANEPKSGGNAPAGMYRDKERGE